MFRTRAFGRHRYLYRPAAALSTPPLDILHQNTQTYCVAEYALCLGNATTAAKVGFSLDQHRQTLKVEDAHLRPLRELRPRQPHYLERGRRNAGRLVADWNLVVPASVLQRSWEEVV